MCCRCCNARELPVQTDRPQKERPGDLVAGAALLYLLADGFWAVVGSFTPIGRGRCNQVRLQFVLSGKRSTPGCSRRAGRLHQTALPIRNAPEGNSEFDPTLRRGFLWLGSFCGPLGKTVIIFGNPQNVGLGGKASGMTRKGAHLFRAFSPIGGIVQMRAISHCAVCCGIVRSSSS